MNTLLHCSYSMIIKNIKLYLILIIQIVLSILIFVGLIGKLQFLSSSKSITHTFNKANAYYLALHDFIDSNSLNTKEILFKEFNKDFQIGEIYNLALKSGENIDYAYGYNDTVLDMSNIEMKTGKWFNSSENYAYIPVVCIGNEYKTGSIIEFENEDGTLKQKAQVIGTIDKEEYIIKFNESGSKSVASIGYFVSTPVENYRFIIPYMCKSFNAPDTKLPIRCKNSINQIVISPDSIDNTSLEDFLKPYGEVVNISQMTENYKTEIKDHFITNGIIFIIFLLLSIASIGGTNGIQSILNRKRFVIYYILGLTQKKCAIIEALRSFFIIFTSFIISIFIFKATPVSGMYRIDEFTINIFTFIWVFIFMLLLYCITSLIYVIKLGNKNLIGMYKQNT